MTDFYAFCEKHNIERVIIDEYRIGRYEVMTIDPHLPFLIKDHIRATYEVLGEENNVITFKLK